MKRFAASLVILAMLLGLVVFAVWDLNWRTQATLELLQEVEDQLSDEDRERTLKMMEELCRQWEEHEDTMTHYVRHDQLEDVSKQLERAMVLARWNDPTDLAADLAEARHHVEHLRTFELPGILE